MCLIVKCDSNIPLNEAFVKNVSRHNPDGWGAMWIKHNQLQVRKSLEMSEIYGFYESKKEFNPILHFRYKTHGAKDMANAHPYYIGYGIYMMHNGVINIPTPTEGKSDTWHFVEHWIKPLFRYIKNPHDYIRSTDFSNRVRTRIGNTNRLVFGDRGGFVIINEDAWYQIPDEATQLKGLIVSNVYAWDEDYNQTKKEKIHYSSKYKNHTTEYTKVDERWVQVKEDLQVGPGGTLTTGKITAATSAFRTDEDQQPSLAVKMELEANRAGMTQIVTNLHHDVLGQIFAYNGRKNSWIRIPHLDKIYGAQSDGWRLKRRGALLTKNVNDNSTPEVVSATPAEIEVYGKPTAAVINFPVVRTKQGLIQIHSYPGSEDDVAPDSSMEEFLPDVVSAAEQALERAGRGESIQVNDADALEENGNTEYNRLMILELKNQSAEDIHQFCYSEPDNAARLIHYLLQQV